MPSVGQGAQPLAGGLAKCRNRHFAKPAASINAPCPPERQHLKPGAGQGATAFSQSQSLGRLQGIFLFCITPFGREFERTVLGRFFGLIIISKPSPSRLSVACLRSCLDFLLQIQRAQIFQSD